MHDTYVKGVCRDQSSREEHPLPEFGAPGVSPRFALRVSLQNATKFLEVEVV
jgi:hypothetical protein